MNPRLGAMMRLLKSIVPHRLGGATRGLLPPLWLCVLVALLVPASGARILASGADRSREISPADQTATAPDRTAYESAESTGPVFRLGNAAGPFGWSTAIGDFDDDGQPDVAVVDHIGSRAIDGRYAYRIEVATSMRGENEIAFESSDGAITVSAFDVDDDDDLDIVVGRPLSGRTLGVWLNDGNGHFTSTDIHKLPASLQARETLRTTDPLLDLAAFDVSRRGDQGLPVGFRLGRAAPRHCAAAASGNRFPPTFPSAVVRPRAPPSSSLI